MLTMLRHDTQDSPFQFMHMVRAEKQFLGQRIAIAILFTESRPAFDQMLRGCTIQLDLAIGIDRMGSIEQLRGGEFTFLGDTLRGRCEVGANGLELICVRGSIKT